MAGGRQGGDSACKQQCQMLHRWVLCDERSDWKLRAGMDGGTCCCWAGMDIVVITLLIEWVSRRLLARLSSVLSALEICVGKIGCYNIKCSVVPPFVRS